jgi:hypothetical protein
MTNKGKRQETIPAIPASPASVQKSVLALRREEARLKREEARRRALKARSAGSRDLARPELRRHAPRPVPRREVINAASADEAHRTQRAETERLMHNWAAWKSGSSISVAVSSAFALEARGRREAVSMPLINGEASDVDQAVDALPADLHQVVVVHWLDQLADRQGRARKARGATFEQRARSCGCTVPTYYRRLEAAHERIHALMRAKRDQAERARELYRTRGAGSLVKTAKP